MTATTALTAQNTQGVFGIHLTPSDFVRKQIDACLTDIHVDVVKIGNLYPVQYPPFLSRWIMWDVEVTN